MERIAYRRGYKYQLSETYEVTIPELSGRPPIVTDYISIINGSLSIRKGYAWDGPSGPTIDTKDFMRGALIHDALYQLLREGMLPAEDRKVADIVLKRTCIEDGMFFVRANVVYLAVRAFASFAADPANKKPIIHAPK